MINLPVANPAAELSGFFDALPRVCSDESVLVSCPRLIVGRRLLKLRKGLNENLFDAKIREGDGALELDKKLGRAAFKLSRELFAAISGRRRRWGEKWAWFRGLWGGCGAFYLPQSGYYMSLRLKDGSETCRLAAGVLNSAGVAFGSRKSRVNVEYTIRDQEGIVTCLSAMGLVRSSLALEETAIVRSIKNRVNKLMNCDSANISKSVDAAVFQLALVDRIDSGGLWHRLTPLQIELAAARRANPSASLGELGQMLAKPVSKSTVEYRWRKLAMIIDE
ncbi:MAG: DNA-binding protein WhiA [Synergistaceae bacterium]|nr:DNA-binding protein WhiA [Synergistaceae bacterium]